MPADGSRIAYLTDVEGRWDKLATFARGSAEVRLADDDTLELAEDVTFVFGGDVCDRGPHARRLVRCLLAAKRRYGARVVLLAGNRDLNKLRLRRELDGAPPLRTPSALRSGPRAPLLQWILAHTMGAREAFEHRRVELSRGREAHGVDVRDVSDEAVVESFREDVAPGGPMLAYLRACRLAYRSGATLFVHGGVTEESLGAVPGRSERVARVDAWIEALDATLAEELDRFERGASPDVILAYQAPMPGTPWNQGSVVYGRLADEHANPTLPEPAVVRALEDEGVTRLVVGHTPSGDCPAILRDEGFELVLADNSYGRIEEGSRVVLTDDVTRVTAVTQLDDGRREPVALSARRADEGPLGRRDPRTGRLVKARLAGGPYLLFRGLPERRVEQTVATDRELDAIPLGAPRLLSRER